MKITMKRLSNFIKILVLISFGLTTAASSTIYTEEMVLLAVIGNILDFLTTKEALNFSRVSKEWQKAFKYINRLDFSDPCFSLYNKQEFLSVISAHIDNGFSNIKELDLHSIKFTNNEWLGISKNFYKMPNLKYLNLKKANITPEALSIILANCGQALEKLDMENCSNYIIPDKWLEIASNFPKMPNLKTLELGYANITGKALSIVLKKCDQNLEKISLNNCNYISSNHWLKIAKNFPDMPNLKHLDFSNTNIKAGALLIILKKCCASLNKLNLYGCLKITVDEWLYIAENFPDMPNLKTLELSNTYITSAARLKILQKCGKTLETLDLSCCGYIKWLDIS